MDQIAWVVCDARARRFLPHVAPQISTWLSQWAAATTLPHGITTGESFCEYCACLALRSGTRSLASTFSQCISFCSHNPREDDLPLHVHSLVIVPLELRHGVAMRDQSPCLTHASLNRACFMLLPPFTK
jgi:hypothetical protein